MARWRSAVRRVWPKAGRAKAETISYTTEAANESLFTPWWKPSAPREEAQYFLRSQPLAGLIRVNRQERLDGCLPGMGPIHCDVKHAVAEFMGQNSFDTSVEVNSHAEARDESHARRMLEAIRVSYARGGHLSLWNRPMRGWAHFSSQFTVSCPAERAVIVRGVNAALRFSDLSRWVEAETTQGRITLFNVAPAVTARAVNGVVDYSGHEGTVRLYAGWEVNLNFTEPVFEGTLYATAEGPVRVLLPRGFLTSFEVNVAREAEFVCRADVAARMMRREENGRVIHSFGEEGPYIRLLSLKGPVVMDNAVGPWEEAMENAMLRPKRPMLRAQAAVDLPYIS